MNSEQNSQFLSHNIKCDSFPSTLQKQIKFPATRLISDRCGISQRAVTSIPFCVLQDVGMINEGNMTLDKNNIRREKHKARYSVQPDSSDVEFAWIIF